MPRIDFVKRHQSAGCYERLVELGKTAFLEGKVESVEAGVRLAISKHRDIAQLALDGPKDPQWTYMPIIKDEMHYVDREAISRENINTAYRLNPTFARQVGRGDFMVPASALIEKRGGVPIPPGLTACEALMQVAKRLEAGGMPISEAMGEAAYEHPDWYEQDRHEATRR